MLHYLDFYKVLLKKPLSYYFRYISLLAIVGRLSKVLVVTNVTE